MIAEDIPGTGLPYAAMFEQAEQEGRPLHREDIYTSGPPVDLVSEEILHFVVENTGSSVLDVGCGLGPYLGRLTEVGKRCVGIDLDREIVEAAQRLGRDVRRMSAYDIRFDDSSFDSVIMIETLEHLEDYERALTEGARVARDTLVITVPDMSVLPTMSKRQVVPWHMLEASHVNFFTPEIMRKTLIRFAESCEVTKLGAFFDVDGEVVCMHVGAVARLRSTEPVASRKDRG